MSICYWDGKCGVCGHAYGKEFVWKEKKAIRCSKCGNEALRQR
jgi:DNA-directed RNA polymerase subunit RPC12/RpoP